MSRTTLMKNTFKRHANSPLFIVSNSVSCVVCRLSSVRRLLGCLFPQSNSPILEPDLYVGFCEFDRTGQLTSLFSSHVMLSAKSTFQQFQLRGCKNSPCSFPQFVSLFARFCSASAPVFRCEIMEF